MPIRGFLNFGVILQVIASLSTIAYSQGAPKPIKSMQENRADFSLVAASDGLIYAIGGESETPSMEALDLETMTWSKKPAPFSLRYGAGAVEVDGEIVVIGGTTDFDHSDNHAGGDNYVSDIWSYHLGEKSWSVPRKVDFPRTNLAVAKVGGTVYAVGGSGRERGAGETVLASDPKLLSAHFTDAHGIRLANSFELVTGLSSLFSPMRFRRTQHAFVSGLNHQLYALGGNLQGDMYGYPLHSVEFGKWYLNGIIESYDPNTQKWTSVARMRTPRVGLAAVTAMNGKIYVIGGATRASGGSGITNLVETFDPVTRKWEVKSPMPTPRWRHAATLGKDGRIYVAGGVSTKQSISSVVEVYDPATDKWETSALPTFEDGLDFNTLNKLFYSSEVTPPGALNELVGWRTGRCFRYDEPEIPYAALLIGYESSTHIKVYDAHYEGRSAQYFDVISEKKRSEIVYEIEKNNQYLNPARLIPGKYVSAILDYDSKQKRRVFEQQIKQTQDYFIVQTKIITDTALERVIDFCYHKKTSIRD